MTSRTFIFAVATFTVAPGAAKAQTGLFSDCPPGTFQACNSVLVSLVLVPSHQFDGFGGAEGEGWATALTIRIRSGRYIDLTTIYVGNYGQPTWAPPFSPWIGDPGFVAPVFEGTAQAIGTSYLADGNWKGVWMVHSMFGEGDSIPVWIQRQAQIYDGGYVIAGCDGLTPGADGMYGVNANQAPGYFQTCGEAWVAYTFLTPPLEFTANPQVSVGITPLDYRGICGDVGVDCPAYATPEPVTVTLLGTGLIGLGAAALRRRKTSISREARARAASSL